MIDVGGSNVKLMRSGHPQEMLKFPSTGNLSGKAMVEKALSLVARWSFDCVTLGFPGVVRQGVPVADPINLGSGWKDFDYAAAFQKPVRIINDALLQGLSHYEGGRMFFFGLGTSVACAIGMDGIVSTVELGWFDFRDRILSWIDSRRKPCGLAE